MDNLEGIIIHFPVVILYFSKLRNTRHFLHDTKQNKKKKIKKVMDIK